MIPVAVVFFFFCSMIHASLAGLVGLGVIVGIIAVALWFKKKLPPIPGKRVALLVMIPTCGICSLALFRVSTPRMVERCKMAIHAGNLHTIGLALITYHEESGTYPEDLRQLVGAGLDPVFLLAFNTKSGKEFGREKHMRPYRGPCDYSYTRLPEGAPEDLVWVWLDPQFFHDEWAFAMLKDGSMTWLIAAEEFSEMLTRTHTWIRNQPTTAATKRAGIENE